MKDSSLSSQAEQSMPHLIQSHPRIVNAGTDAQQVEATQQSSGAGAGALDSVALVCLGRGYPEQVKPRMIAVISSCWMVPGLIGPAFAGIVVAALS